MLLPPLLPNPEYPKTCFYDALQGGTAVTELSDVPKPSLWTGESEVGVPDTHHTATASLSEPCR